MNDSKFNTIWFTSVALLSTLSINTSANVVVMQKQNTEFSIDGNNGAQQGQQIYLYKTDTDNINQQWIETSIDGNYVYYRKENTNLCLDGGQDGKRRQAVTLEICDEENENQHWEKINTSNASFRLEKRGTNFSIDGNNGGTNKQLIYLWDSNNSEENQQWSFLNQDNTTQENNAPIVSFDSPDNITLPEGETLYVAVNADDPNGSIASVSLSINDDFVRTEMKAPYGWGNRDVKLQNLSPGTYHLTAVAEDNDGLTSQVSTSITIEGEQSTTVGTKPNATVFSLTGLREAITENNQTIIVESGNYSITELPSSQRSFVITGNNNIIDLTDVHINFPVNETSEAHFVILGSGNTIKNGTLENTYPNGQTEITDFVSYNNDDDDFANGNDVHIKITGDDNSLIGTKLTVRGSFPFGYGSYFGIGSDSSFKLVKRGGIQIGGRNALIDGIELYLHAFGHGIYMQENADNTIIRNSLVEGLIRETNDILDEGPGSLPFQEDFKDFEGNPIPANEVESLAEDGIRSYGQTGSVTVENCTVRNMRGGIRLYLASSATVSNSTSIDSGLSNFNMPNNGKIVNSSGNFTYAPLNDHRLSRSGQDIEMTILPSPNAIGSHNIADILGNNHDIIFHRADGPEDSQESRAIVVSGNNSTIRNETEYRIILESGTQGNTIISAGDVTDNGDNDISRISLDL